MNACNTSVGLTVGTWSENFELTSGVPQTKYVPGSDELQIRWV